MSSLYTQQDTNVAKTWILMICFFAAIVALGWFFGYAYNDPSILYFAVIFSLVMNVGSYWFSDKIVLATSRAQPIDRSQAPDLYNIVENLAMTAGLPMPRLYLINDPAPNAFATGRNKEHAAVAVTSGLLQMMNRTELEGVLAHELSHVGNKDILISSVVVVLVGFVALLSDFFRRSLIFGGRRRNSDEGGGGVMILIGLVLAILSPIAATLIQLAISRRRESLADASGALLTRYPEGLASALEKIGNYSGQLRHANNATAHLYISNPFGADRRSGATSFLARLFMTHPPIEERIRALRESERA